MLLQDSVDLTAYDTCLIPTRRGKNLRLFYHLNRILNPRNQHWEENLSGYAITPDGEKQPLTLLGVKGNQLTYQAVLEKEGVYHFFAVHSGYFSEDGEGRRFSGNFADNPWAVSATRYFHYAHTALKVGRGPAFTDHRRLSMPPLYLVSDRRDQFRVGETFDFTLYFRGTPLPLYEITFLYLSKDGTQEEFITDGEGRMSYPLSKIGNYLLTVSYTTPEDEDALYFETKYTYSFWFNVQSSAVK